ncbi:hypothetical protein A7X67_15725 [Clostridium sp. W14A]|nr:hypothetical protein A7X67_15725 [Clostridium sp. W14A]
MKNSTRIMMHAIMILARNSSTLQFRYVFSKCSTFSIPFYDVPDRISARDRSGKILGTEFSKHPQIPRGVSTIIFPYWTNYNQINSIRTKPPEMLPNAKAHPVSPAPPSLSVHEQRHAQKQKLLSVPADGLFRF